MTRSNPSPAAQPEEPFWTIAGQTLRQIADLHRRRNNAAAGGDAAPAIVGFVAEPADRYAAAAAAAW